MSEPSTTSAPPGRPVRLVPTPPGFWMLVLGICTAAFAPLFGFLAGSMVGSIGTDPLMHPLYWGLFLGMVLGGFGVMAAIAGGWRLWSHTRRRESQEDAS